MDLRTHFANLTAINETMMAAAAAHYRDRGYTYVDVPAIVGITGACENVDTLFGVSGRSGDQLFFTQTGQLALEHALVAYPRVWTSVHSGRDELVEDERHVRQFRLTEEEFDATTVGMDRDDYDEEMMLRGLLTNLRDAVQSMLFAVLSDHGRLLTSAYGRDMLAIADAVDSGFYRVRYEVALDVLRKVGFELAWGDDLSAEHEAALSKHFVSAPFFITHYPKELKFFNMRVSRSDPRVCLSADLILPFAGEAAGAAVREHEYEPLRDRLLESRMAQVHVERGGSLDDFGWYLDLVKSEATQPHAGYGIGNQRLLQYILGEPDIRRASPFWLLDAMGGTR